jgi:excisionase family DNA binding protein
MSQQIVVTTQAELRALIEQAVFQVLSKNGTTTKVHDAVLGMKEAAAYLGIPKATLYQLTSQRRIGFIKIGRLSKFRTSDLDACLLANRKATKEEIIQNSNARK